MSNLSKAGTSVLNMDEIFQLLDIKYDLITKDELAYAGDRTTDPKDKTGKTLLHKNGQKIKEIAGVNPRLFAVVENEDDRKTIRNALNLGGKPASDYFTSDEAVSVKSKLNYIQKTYESEISELRDEMNQMRMELSKKGVIEEYKPYAGFYDVFHTDYPVHLNGIIATADEDTATQNRIHLKEDDFDKFTVGDRILITTDLIPGTNGSVICTIKDKLNSKGVKNTLELDQAAGFTLKAGTTHIYKSYGMNYKNTFSFGQFVDDKPSDNLVYTGVDDDNYRIRKRITAPRTGYATTFRISPSKANGTGKFYLNRIEVQVKKYGNPGDLMCYVINADDISKWINPKQAQDDGILIAQSQPLHVDERDGEHVEEFTFSDNGTLPLIKNIDMGDKKDRFCMIVEALDADTRSNYYEILFLQHYDAANNTFTDLQLNNDCYVYEQMDQATMKRIRNDSTTSTGALYSTEEMTKCDMYYGVTLRQVEEGEFVPYEEGLYSAHFTTQEPIEINSARLALRVAREGIYKVKELSTLNGDIAPGDKITFAEDKTYRLTENDMAKDILGFSNDIRNRKIAVGTNICEPENVMGEVLTPANGFHVDIGDPVYPIGYTARLVAKNIKWDKNTNKRVTSKTMAIPLKLTQIQPDHTARERENMDAIYKDKESSEMSKARIKSKNRLSDRLIFEGSLTGLFDANDETLKYNDFEIQIDWKHSCSQMTKSFAGRIYDLSVSLNR